MNWKLGRDLFLIFMLTGSLFAGEDTLQFEIVPFDLQDADMKEQISSLIRDDQDIKSRLFPMASMDTDEDLQCFWREFTRNNILVCRSVNKKSVCGFLHYRIVKSRGNYFAEPHGYVEGLAVHQNYRGHGIAQNLLNRCEDDCKKIECLQTLELCVAKNNDKAIRVYNKQGFELRDFSEYRYEMSKSLHSRKDRTIN